MSHEPPSPTSERRLVSVLFVDLEDFTRLVEQLDPEDARGLQSRYFALARSIIERHGGTVEKYIGDAVMAVWGAPRAREDDGEHAVRAAMETVEAVARLEAPRIAGQLRARAAVASGEVAVSPAVDGQGMLAGDPVNTAARLQSVAPVGAVLVDEATRRLARRGVRFEAAGMTALKGKSRPIEAWLAAAVKAPSGGARRAGHGGPFVGREAALSSLLRAYERTAADRPRLVAVLGIAGIGKSRLGLELEAVLRAGPVPPVVLVGHATAYGEGRPFAALANIVRRWAGIGTRSSAASAARRLARAVDPGDAAQLGPRIAALLDPSLGSGFEREELFAAWRRVIERIGSGRTAVLLLEDVQWADDGMLDFVQHLCRWRLEIPLLIVTLARPELLERRPDWLADVAGAEQLDLVPLTDEAMTRLLAGLAPELPLRAVRMIIDRAGGVPLYAVEFVRLRGLDPVADPAHLPDTLRALVAARLDSLSTGDRWLLLRCSVLGNRFDGHSLAELTGIHDSALPARLEPLIQSQLLAAEEVPTGAEVGPQFAFLQDVVRDVAYRTLSRAERRELHLATADHLAAEHPALVEEIAEHLYRSHRMAPDDPASAAVAQRAVTALASAADRATAVHVPERALRHLERALALAADEEQRLTLLTGAATAARAAAHFERAEEMLRELIDGHVALGQHGPAARARAQLASLMLAGERHGFALGELEMALAETEDLDSDPAGVELAGQLARAKMLSGSDAESLAWASRTMRAARRLRLPAVHLDALTTRGTARLRLGRMTEGLSDLRRAIAIGQRLGMLNGELRARNNLAWLVVLDDPHVTLDTARGGLQLAQRMGVGDMALQHALVMCMVAIDTGEWDEALAVIDEVREQPQATAHRLQFAAIEATIRGLRGERRQARTMEALQPLARATDPQMAAAIDMALAWIKFAAGRFAAARAAARRGERLMFGADSYVAALLALRADLWLGNGPAVRDGLSRLASEKTRGRMAEAAEQTMRAGAAALLGDASAAQQYERAIAEWRALRLPLHLALSIAERARFHGGDTDEAEEILAALRADALLRLIRLG